MKKLTTLILCALLSASAWSQDQEQPIQAEAYAYGNYLGPVSIEDLTTDGQTIYLKGVQVWPELSDQSDDLPTVSESSRLMSDLLKKVIDQQLLLQEQQIAKIDIATELLDILNSSDLVHSAKLLHEDCIEIRWKDDPYPDYFEIVDMISRPSWQERIEQEMDILKIYIQNNYTLVVSSNVRQGLPFHMRQQAHAEITAIQNGSWQGGLIDSRAAEQFRSPLTIKVN